MPCSFRFEHYKEILEKALKNGYKIIRFKDLLLNLNEKRVILLRHDVDSRLDRALECARLEKSLGVSATYFIRVHSPQYNPFEYKSYKILREIKETGHEIGLHYEVVYLNYLTGEDMLNLLEREKKVLESIINEEIKSAAPHGDLGHYRESYLSLAHILNLHLFKGKLFQKETLQKINDFESSIKAILKSFLNPLKEAFLRKGKSFPLDRLWNFARVETSTLLCFAETGILFHPRLNLLSSFKMVSEGAGHWGEGKCACQYIGKYQKIQINTHPEHWFWEIFFTDQRRCLLNGGDKKCA
jgi:peptidoglycan/xylan/chitin deacetylase (PgdA/CDA1 family)